MCISVGLKDKLFGGQQKTKHQVEKTYDIVALTADWVTAIADNICDIAGSGTTLGVNIPEMVCLNVALTMKYVWLVVLHLLHTPTIILNHNYEVDTLGDGQVWDTWVLAKDTAKNL